MFLMTIAFFAVGRWSSLSVVYSEYCMALLAASSIYASSNVIAKYVAKKPVVPVVPIAPISVIAPVVPIAPVAPVAVIAPTIPVVPVQPQVPIAERPGGPILPPDEDEES